MVGSWLVLKVSVKWVIFGVVSWLKKFCWFLIVKFGLGVVDIKSLFNSMVSIVVYNSWDFIIMLGCYFNWVLFLRMRFMFDWL